MKSEHNERLAKESEFQNRRVQAMHEGGIEPRDRFYYLTKRALADYQSRLQDVAGKFVIVVGCSEGGVTPLAKRGAKVIGIDIADVAIEKLNRLLKYLPQWLSDDELLLSCTLAGIGLV